MVLEIVVRAYYKTLSSRQCFRNLRSIFVVSLSVCCVNPQNFCQIRETDWILRDMSTSSYDELMKHLRCLKAENSHLHRELQINSSHLTKLEMDASTMKDRLAYQLHYGSVGENGTTVVNNHTMGNEQDLERMIAQRSGLADTVQYGLCVSG